MPSIRALALVSGGLFAAIILAALVGNALQDAGIVKDPAALEGPAKITFFALFVAFGFSVIPLMVRLVLGAQILLGNANVPPIRALIAHPGCIVLPLWTLIALGLAVGLPAAIRQGFFSTNDFQSASSSRAAAEAIARIPTQGTLVAAPGMRVDRMIAASTLHVQAGSRSPLFSGARFGGAAIFDYRVAGTGIGFRRCRYYYITTYAKDPTRIEMINVGISSEKMTRAQLNSSKHRIHVRLESDHWRNVKPGLWTKAGLVLDLESRPLDGDWIQYVELRESKK